MHYSIVFTAIATLTGLATAAPLDNPINARDCPVCSTEQLGAINTYIRLARDGSLSLEDRSQIDEVLAREVDIEARQDQYSGWRLGSCGPCKREEKRAVGSYLKMVESGVLRREDHEYLNEVIKRDGALDARQNQYTGWRLGSCGPC